jgi:aspartate/methionine/tyrosine aminotransferase
LTRGAVIGYRDGVSHSSRRAAAIEPFLAMEVAERAFAMQRAGVDVVHLEIGEPGFAPPPPVVAALSEAVSKGVTRYSDSRGEATLREAIAAGYSQRVGRDVDPDRVIVTSGTSPAMLLVFSLLVDPGDEVVIGTPHYPCYPNFIRFCGGHPVLVPTDPASGYQLAIDDVRAACTPRTRAIVVNSPANPTGAIQSAETMRALAEIGPPLVSDEIYGGLVYGDAPVTSALAVTDDAFVLDGFSKRYAMTGFRLGYAIVPPDALRSLQVMQQNLFICASSFVQRAGLAALAHGAEYVERMRQAYAARRDLLLGGLRQLGFVVPVEPAGAFYVFADARRFGGDSCALAFDLLERAHVGVTPGADFGAAGEGWLRFCYAASEDALEEALARLGGVLPGLRRGAR